MWINFRIDAPIGDGNITFGEIKRWIQETYRIPARYQHLQFAPDGFNFELLDDNVTVMAYGLDNDDILYMALAPVATESGSASNMSVNFDGHGNHVGAQNPPETQAGAGNANYNNINNVEDGMFNVHEHLVADLDLNYNPNPDMMIINDPPLMNQHNLNLNAAVDMDDNLNQSMNANTVNYEQFGIILNTFPNTPLFVAGDHNPNLGMMNNPPIMNQNLNAPVDMNDNLNQDMNVNIINYGPLAEIFEFIRNPLLPIDQLGGKQHNPIADELDDWHMGMNPTISTWDKSDALPQINANQFFDRLNETLMSTGRPPWWQSWAAEGGIGAAGEAGPSNTATRSNFKVNIVSEDDTHTSEFLM
ncbi:hypothetical protein M0R45_028179 [Rubus argutus]|uniref:Ubiquitin-like domain-containing protein n=1 Tax=Rubus argutus TaxID=59490 RepID=A0AAW1W3Y0_RUBAR